MTFDLNQHDHAEGIQKSSIHRGAALLVVVFIVSCVAAYQLLAIDRTAIETVRCSITSGSGAYEIGMQLQQCGLVRHARIFELYVRARGVSGELQAGTYLLTAADTLPDIAQRIVDGDAESTDVVVTIPEGMNVWEIDAYLVKNGLTTPGVFAAQAFADEGHLYPDTYRFDASILDMSDTQKGAKIVRDRLHDEFHGKSERYQERQVIIASLLEKEGKSATDMKLIAGIIERRIELGMPLQLDASVAYGWCVRRWNAAHKSGVCDVTQAPLASEIKVDGPYNTYTRVGLPIAPIANPGAASLEAAEHPSESEYLYYLSTRDGSRIVYARTLQEHLKNRKQYLGF